VTHTALLTSLLRERGVAVAALHGDLGKTERARGVAALDASEVSVVVTTTSLIAEGFDQPKLDYLAVTTPMSYEWCVSRTVPGKLGAVVVDYCDDNALCWSSWSKRGAVCRAECLTITTHGEEGAA
jgi:hypothetical protein